MESTPTTLLISLDALTFHVGEDDNEGDDDNDDESDEEFTVDVEAATEARDLLVALRPRVFSS